MDLILQPFTSVQAKQSHLTLRCSTVDATLETSMPQPSGRTVRSASASRPHCAWLPLSRGGLVAAGSTSNAEARSRPTSADAPHRASPACNMTSTGAMLQVPPILNPEAFAAGLCPYLDCALVDYMYIVFACINGINIGYNRRRTRRISPNCSSCITFKDGISSSLCKDVKLGRKLGPYPVPPFNYFMGSPKDTFEKRHSPGKHRIIHDLSWPQGHMWVIWLYYRRPGG